MRETNALLIQENLKKRSFVTVPWLQQEYDLTYLEAKEFLQQLILRSWVKPHAEGIRYQVQHRNLCLRKIRRSEVDGLYTDMTNDCVTALNHLERQGGTGATKRELERVVHGDEDTESAIRTLMKLRLIYQVDELYFLMVSKKTVEVINEVESEKRRTVMRRKMSDSGEKDAEIKKLFDVLFEDPA